MGEYRQKHANGYENEQDIRKEYTSEASEGQLERRMEQEIDKLVKKIEDMVAAVGGPDNFFADGRFELEESYESVISNLQVLMIEAFERHDFEKVLEIGRRALEASGVSGAESASPSSPDDVVALTEAVNLAAKTLSYSYYGLKPLMIVSASRIFGVNFGVSRFDGAYYLHTLGVGAASFHDPYGEVQYFLGDLGETAPVWEYPWSGVTRQDDAFNILESLNSNRVLAQEYSDLTTPPEEKEARDLYMRRMASAKLATIGDILRSKKSVE